MEEYYYKRSWNGEPIEEVKYYNSNEKGDIIESMVAVSLVREKIYKSVETNINADVQMSQGDLKCTTFSNEIEYVEVKTSHTWNNQAKLGMDWQYFQLNSKEPYYLTSTGADIGWLRQKCNYNTLIAFNVDKKEMYIISDWQKVKANIIQQVEEHLQKNRGIKTFFSRRCSDINEHLETGLKYDVNKRVALVFLNLNADAIQTLGGKLTMYKIDLPIAKGRQKFKDVIRLKKNKENKKSLDTANI